MKYLIKAMKYMISGIGFGTFFALFFWSLDQGRVDMHVFAYAVTLGSLCGLASTIWLNLKMNLALQLLLHMVLILAVVETVTWLFGIMSQEYLLKVLPLDILVVYAAVWAVIWRMQLGEVKRVNDKLTKNNRK